MNHDLMGGVPSADDREQMGRFLRYAYPLSLRSFSELTGSRRDHDARAKAPLRR